MYILNFWISQMSKVIEITSIEGYTEFKEKNRRGIIFYGAKWCEACNDIMPLYTRIANRYYKRIAMAHADIDVCQLDFSKVPIFLALRKGKTIDSMEGANNEALKEFIKKAILYDSHPISVPVKPTNIERKRSNKSPQNPDKTNWVPADSYKNNGSNHKQYNHEHYNDEQYNKEQYNEEQYNEEQYADKRYADEQYNDKHIQIVKRDDNEKHTINEKPSKNHEYDDEKYSHSYKQPSVNELKRKSKKNNHINKNNHPDIEEHVPIKTYSIYDEKTRNRK